MTLGVMDTLPLPIARRIGVIVCAVIVCGYAVVWLYSPVLNLPRDGIAPIVWTLAYWLVLVAPPFALYSLALLKTRSFAVTYTMLLAIAVSVLLLMWLKDSSGESLAYGLFFMPIAFWTVFAVACLLAAVLHRAESSLTRADQQRQQHRNDT